MSEPTAAEKAAAEKAAADKRASGSDDRTAAQRAAAAAAAVPTGSARTINQPTTDADGDTIPEGVDANDRDARVGARGKRTDDNAKDRPETGDRKSTKPTVLRADMSDGASSDDAKNPPVRDFADYASAQAQAKALGGKDDDINHVGTAFHVGSGEK